MASSDQKQMQVLLDDLKSRFPEARIYLMGTSRGTAATMALAGYLSNRIDGEIHSSSLQAIGEFDTRKFTNRQLLLHHRDDTCRVTPFSAALKAHEKFGTELIVMEGGTSVGSPCKAYAHHGYNGIERTAVEAVKGWVRRGN